MDEEMTEIVAEAAAEGEDRLDVGALRQDDARASLDRVVKMQGRAKMRIERRERGRLRPAWVEDRQDVGDAACAVEVELIEAADRQGGKGGRLHRRAFRRRGERQIDPVAFGHPLSAPSR